MKKLSIVFIVCLSVANLFAQNASSPYSVIGIGDIEKSNFDRTSGLGHAGVALQSDRYFFVGNPASFSFLQNPSFSNPFYFDLSVRYKNVNFSGTPINSTTTNQSNDLQFKRISFAIKPKAKWGLSFGLLPYSTANYSFNSVIDVQGDNNNKIPINFEGSGSTNLVYLSNSFLLAKGLSIGVQSALLFGQLNDKKIMYSAITDSVLSKETNVYLTTPHFKGGIIYKATINKNWSGSIGATGSLKTSINANYKETVKDGNTTLKTVDEKRIGYSTLPMIGTIGIAATYKNTYTFVFDFNGQNWSSVKYGGINYALVNSSRISAGFQYVNNVTIREKNISVTYEKSFYQAGFYYNKSYLNVKGEPIKEWGVTLGAGTQLNRSGLGIQGNIEIGGKGTTSSNLIKENITQIGVTISYRDFWYTKKIKKYN
jgi:hypothetical protein